MKKKYDKLLKELKKGNAVILDMSSPDDHYYDRFRLVTPRQCHYHTYSSKYFDGRGMSESCFSVYISYTDEKDTERLVKEMEFHDMGFLKIKRMQVLK